MSESSFFHKHDLFLALIDTWRVVESPGQEQLRGTIRDNHRNLNDALERLDCVRSSLGPRGRRMIEDAVTKAEEKQAKPEEVSTAKYEAIATLQQCVTERDTEKAHRDADWALIVFLKNAGFQEVADAWLAAYNERGFWYA